MNFVFFFNKNLTVSLLSVRLPLALISVRYPLSMLDLYRLFVLAQYEHFQPLPAGHLLQMGYLLQ